MYYLSAPEKLIGLKRRFVEHGLEAALNKRKADRQRFKKIDGDIEAHLVAISCSQPPQGQSALVIKDACR